MTRSVAIGPEAVEALGAHLVRNDGQEDLCFALWRPSEGLRRSSALITEVVLPGDGERHVHGNASFEESYFLRAVALASGAGAGLALLHSHPGGTTWQGLSSDDYDAEVGHAAQSLVATALPLLGLTLATASLKYSARIWTRTAPRTYAPVEAESVRLVGDRLSVSFNPQSHPMPSVTERQRRTVDSWGIDTQADLARLHIGVVGLGSVGAIVAEALARIGIGRLSLLDFDSVKEHNLDRLINVSRDDLGKAKAAAISTAAWRSATADNFQAESFELSICEEAGFRHALDCDVLFSCVDRPWGRHVLNAIAYGHLIPVIDGGIGVQSEYRRGLRGVHITSRVATAGRMCLECSGQYRSEFVALERDGYLDDPTYIMGLPLNHVLRRAENVFPFSLQCAAFELAQFVRFFTAPQGLSNVGSDDYEWVPGHLAHGTDGCADGCFFNSVIGLGEAAEWTPTGRHGVAERERAQRELDLGGNASADGGVANGDSWWRRTWRRLVTRARTATRR